MGKQLIKRAGKENGQEGKRSGDCCEKKSGSSEYNMADKNG